MGRHAYLILAHGKWSHLSALLSLLDDARNDFYLHIDKNADFSKREEAMLRAAARFSSVTFVPRVKIAWGGFSMVRAEMNLLRAAAAGHYDYYHLVSGADLPLKTQDEIHAFFDAHAGREFIGFAQEPYKERFLLRLKYRHYFQKYIGRPGAKKGLVPRVFTRLERFSVAAQKRLGVDGLSGIRFGYGSQWFSITDQFARYLLENEKALSRRLRYSMVSDELLAQIAVLNSPFADACEKRNMRHIDWTRGSPYVFRSGDDRELLSTDDLFARKFDESVDSAIMDLIRSRARKKQNAPDQ